MTKLAFLGLGTMGFPMAGYLVNAGHHVRVWNRTTSTAKQWGEAFAGHVADTAEHAVMEADFVFACLGDDPDVRAIADRVFSHMKKGAVFVDHTTTSADLAREIANMAASFGLGFVDAPVSGGQAGAENGQLTIICGGSKPDFDATRPIMKAYAKAIKHMGAIGSGQLTKMVNQICIAGVLQGLAEGLNFAKAAGLDPIAVVEAIGQGAAQSWQMDNRHKTMAANEFDFGFAVDWMRKDLRVAMQEAKVNGAKLPMVEMVDQFYADVQAMGGSRWDTSSLIALLRQD